MGLHSKTGNYYGNTKKRLSKKEKYPEPVPRTMHLKSWQ